MSDKLTSSYKKDVFFIVSEKLTSDRDARFLLNNNNILWAHCILLAYFSPQIHVKVSKKYSAVITVM